MTKPNTVLVTLLAALAIPAAHAGNLVEKAQRDEVFSMSREDAAMKRAFGKARATFDQFLRAAAAPAPGTSDYAVKVAVTEGGNTEYFWVGDFARSGEQFSGNLANEPRLVKKYRHGQRIAFRRDQIVDWIYMDASRKMIGNFTACARLAKESPEDARKFRETYGLDCD